MGGVREALVGQVVHSSSYGKSIYSINKSKSLVKENARRQFRCRPQVLVISCVIVMSFKLFGTRRLELPRCGIRNSSLILVDEQSTEQERREGEKREIIRIGVEGLMLKR